MKKYDDINMIVAERVFEMGDERLEKRKKRAAKIRHISYAVSGLCAAVIVCFGAWHFSSDMKNPNANFHDTNIISTTEPAKTETTTSRIKEQTIAQIAITTTKSTTNTTVTTLNTTKTGVSLQSTTLHITQVPSLTTVPIVITNTSATHITKTTIDTVPSPVTTIMPCEVTSTKITAPIKQTVTSIQEQEIKNPVSETVPVSTPVVTTITNLKSFFMDSKATLVINDKNNIVYEKQNEIISKDLINSFILAYHVQIIKPDETLPTEYNLPVFSITNISEEEAVAVRTPDTYEYYLFRNMDYKKEDYNS